MTVVWQTGTIADSVAPEFSFHAALGPRTVVSGVLALGLTYLSLITVTMRRYGDVMDQAWRARVKSWVEEIEAEEKANPRPIIPPVRVTVGSHRIDERTGYPFHGEAFALDHTGYPASARDHQDEWPPIQIPELGEPRPVVPFVDAPAPGPRHGSVASRDLYQERYRTASSRASISVYGYVQKVEPPKLPLPPSDDRVFRRREYIDNQVLKWLSRLPYDDASNERSPVPPNPEGDEQSTQARESVGMSEDPSAYPPPPPPTAPKDSSEGAEQRFAIPGSITKSEEERVTSWLGRVDLRPGTPPVGEHHHLTKTRNQQGDTTPQVGATRAVPEGDVNAAPLETAQADHEPTHGVSDLSPPASLSISEALVPESVESSSSAPTPELHHKKSQEQLNQPALQLTPMNGLQSTANMQLGTHRVLPYPELGAERFSREGKLVKILHLDGVRVGDGKVSPAHGSKPEVVLPRAISPQVLHTFTSVCCEMSMSVSILVLTSVP